VAEVKLAISAAAWHEVQNDEEKLLGLAACADPTTGFRKFLDYWWFLDQETKKPRILGEVLWEGQQEIIDSMITHDWLYELKARKLGFTTLGIAFDAWVIRFRGANERVHLFSRREAAANELLDNVKYGLQRLPRWMKLPAAVWKSNEIALIGGDDDIRRAVAYPADEDTAVESTCTHGHVDEWQRMRNPQRVWQAIEPTMAGTCHIITTGLGPANFGSKFWVMTMNGDTEFHPLFVPATARPGRSLAWVEAKRRSMPETDARQEYPLSWEDSLYAGADLPLAGDKLQRAGAHPELRLLESGEDGHEYVKAWDIGRHQDAAVCLVLDVTETPVRVVHYRRRRNWPYPSTQVDIEEVHELFAGPTVIEDNAAGEAVRENVQLVPDVQIFGFKTTGSSKPRLIKRLEVGLSNDDIEWNEDATSPTGDMSQLKTELATYQIPDTNVVQDTVMALGIAYEFYVNPKEWKRWKGLKKGRARVFTA
jgi:hypothetical protein